MTSIDPENIGMSDAGAAFAKKLTSSERTPEDVFRRVSGHLGPFFHASVVVFAKAAEDPGNFEVVYQWTGAEADGHGERIALKSFIDAGQFDMLTLGTPVSIEDRDETISINAETINGPAVGSYIVIPYLVGGQLAYVLGLFRADPARWQPDEVRILSDASENVFTRYERTLAQVALARSIMFDEAVLGNIAEGLCTLDRSGRLLTINPAGEQILGTQGFRATRQGPSRVPKQWSRPRYRMQPVKGLGTRCRSGRPGRCVHTKGRCRRRHSIQCLAAARER